jgi:hypothetical protein
MQHSLLFDAIIKQPLQGESVANHLQQIINAHPYFTPAQFYLLQQLNSNDENYSKQAATTALLFNNPYWLQFQLQQSNHTTATVKETPVIAMFAENADNDDDNAVIVQQEKVINEELVEVPENTGNNDATAMLTEDNTLPEPVVEISENSNNDDDTAVLVHDASPANEAESDANLTDEQEDTQTELEMPPIKIDLAASIKEAENENALSFEPMHLVDYFASQGIKLSDDIQTADKLGKQLKSFTEWLKTMKKVHTPGTETAAVTADISIQTLAEKSNAEDEIVTEAMAEVFAQQGKARKAIEVYKKLSLLNPLKSAFFAAKIEQLKGS